MKRLTLLLTVLLLASLACTLGATPESTGEPVQPSPLPPVEESAAPVPPVDGNPPALNADCGNVYIPVIPGASWTYSLSGPASDTYTHSILSVGQASFVEQDAFGSGVTRMGEWSCDRGNLTALNPGGGGATVNTEGLSSQFEATSNSGVTFPADPKPGDTWSQSVTLEGSQTINGYNAPAKNQVNTTCTAIGMESVTVPAGTFEALRVDCVIEMIISVNAGGNAFDTTLNTTSATWYAPNVGMVKSVTIGNGLDSTTELTSYSLPQQ